MSANQWAKAIANAYNCREENIPKGFKTVKQLCNELEMPERTMRARIDLLKKTNKIEIQSFRTKRSDNRFVSTPHYRLIKCTN